MTIGITGYLILVLITILKGKNLRKSSLYGQINAERIESECKFETDIKKKNKIIF